MYTGWIDKSVRMSADVSILTHFGYKWLDEKKVHCLDLTDFAPFYSGETLDDYYLCEAASKIFQEADHIVAHYGDKFDRRYMTAKFEHHNLPSIPPSPFLRQTDTCKIAKNHFKLSSNRLDNIAAYLNVPMKLKKNWPEDWILMTKKDVAAFVRINTYCKGDVSSLEGVFLKIRKYSNQIPNHSFKARKDCCPTCGSESIIANGKGYTKENVIQRYKCTDCGKRFDERKFAC